MNVFCRINYNEKHHYNDIGFEEWRDFLLFHPGTNLYDIIDTWRHDTVSSIILFTLPWAAYFLQFISFKEVIAHLLTISRSNVCKYLAFNF